MCGIFSIVNFDGEEVSEEALNLMSTKMYHRGPDDEGVLIDGNVGIGMRRLSIIDLKGGHQPISNETDDIYVVLNGEIYNYKELRKDLKAQGHKFRTKSDVEVLVHLYEEYGTECIHKINGMFAFVLYDQRNQEVWIARDRLGIKPLYYYYDNQKLIAGSDLSSVNAIVKASIDKYSLMLYIGHSYVPAPKTIYNNIVKLMPSEQITIKNNKVLISKYWNLEASYKEIAKKEDAVGLLRKSLENSIKLQTRCDVPIGVFLSGGVDSSAIATLMKQERPDFKFHTFTVDYADKGSEDPEFAYLISQKVDSIHHVIHVTDGDQINALKKLIPMMDEPVSDSAIVPMFIISEKARKLGVKVMLNGAGGDEIFGGYPRYFVDRIGSAEWLSSLPKMIKKILFSPLWVFNKSLLWRLSSPQNNFIYSISGVNVDFLKQATKRREDYIGLLNGFIEDFKSSLPDNIYSRMKLDFHNYLPNNILSITDKATMAASIEGRVPLLDHKLVELSFSIPEKFNILNGIEKGLFKEVISDLVPKAILVRKKDGFGAPIFSWIEQWKNEIKIELIDNATPELADVFDICVVKKWLSSKRLRAQAGETLYALYVLNLWIRRHAS